MNSLGKDIIPGRLLKISFLLLLRSTVVQSSVPLQLPDRELDAFPSFPWRGRGSSFHSSPHAPKSNALSTHELFRPAKAAATHLKPWQPRSWERDRDNRQLQKVRTDARIAQVQIIDLRSQIQLSRFAAEKDAPSTQHQGFIVTAMVPLKRGRPKMRARPWISMIGRTPSQAPPAR